MENRNDILNELREISPVLVAAEKVNVYTVPAGYFNDLAGNILQLIKEENSPFLSGINKQAGHVPEGYFDTLADSILGKIKAQQNEAYYPVLDTVSKQNVYTVPDGYFETLAAAVSGEIKARENEAFYPVLDKISKQNVYAVPDGYFETLSEVVAAKVSQPQTKVVSMGKRTGWFKYAAAASVVFMLTLGVYKFTGSTNTKMDAVTKEGMAIAKDNKFEEVLTNVAEEDIIQYLQKEGADVETALVAQTIDEKDLPSQEDYLLDEKALDNFLDNIDVKDLNN
jgi:hypothetical protein